MYVLPSEGPAQNKEIIVALGPVWCISQGGRKQRIPWHWQQVQNLWIGYRRGRTQGNDARIITF